MTSQKPAPRPRSTAGIDQARSPWTLTAGHALLTVRGASPKDLPGVALMHSRCSAKSLLDRYRVGGRSPAVAVLDRYVRQPISFVASTDDGRVVAVAHVAPDPVHLVGCGEIAILVEDAWQELGIGSALLRHVSAAALLGGYRQLISYPGTTAASVQRLMQSVGTTRPMLDVGPHLHTALPEIALLGLGGAGLHRAVG